jgi:hypothetical protein
MYIFLWIVCVLHTMQHYVIKFFSDLRYVGSFVWVLQFPPQIKLTAMMWLNIVESGIKHNKPNLCNMHEFVYFLTNCNRGTNVYDVYIYFQSISSVTIIWILIGIKLRCYLMWIDLYYNKKINIQPFHLQHCKMSTILCL